MPARLPHYFTASAILLASTIGCATGSGITNWFGGGSMSKNPLASAGSSLSNGMKSAWNSTANFFKPKTNTTASTDTSESKDTLSLDRGTKSPGPEFHVSLARLQEGSGNLSAAIDQYEKALQATPHYLPALTGLARIYDRQGKLDDAARYYQQAVEKFPNEAPAFNDLGMCLHKLGRDNDAVQALKRAVELQGDKVLYRNNLAMVLVQRGQAEDAIAQLTPVHGEAIARYNVGFMLTKLGHNDQALQQFQRALALNPKFEAAATWVALLEQKGQAVASAVAPVVDAFSAPAGQSSTVSGVLPTGMPTSFPSPVNNESRPPRPTAPEDARYGQPLDQQPQNAQAIGDGRMARLPPTPNPPLDPSATSVSPTPSTPAANSGTLR